MGPLLKYLLSVGHYLSGTFATLSAPNGHADPIERCPLLGAKRKTSARSEHFAFWPNVWSGRALQEVSSSWHQRSCINVSGLWLELFCSGPSWISARVRSHYRTDLKWASWVTSVRMRREDRSSISSHPLADLGG